MGQFLDIMSSKRLLATLLGVSGAVALNKQLHGGQARSASPAKLYALPERMENAVAARKNVHSFEPREFTSADDWFGLFTNQHWQTIVGSGALAKTIYGKEAERSFSTVKHRVKTQDGDFFDVEFTDAEFGPELAESFEVPISLSVSSVSTTAAKEKEKEEDEEAKNEKEKEKRRLHDTTPIVVVLHGLEATSRGTLVTKMCEAYLDQGFACALVSFRGCSSQGEGEPSEPNLRPGAYHLGFTDDVNQLTYYLQKQYPNRPIYLSGFSLGGNVCLKFLGELGHQAVLRNIRGAVTMSVPYDAVASGGKIDTPGINKTIYAGNFLRTLKAKAEKQHKLFPDAFDIDRIRSCQTLGDFDDAFIATIYGFQDKVDYYRSTGSVRWIPKIRVPAITINAVDDPFIEPSSLPDPKRGVADFQWDSDRCGDKSMGQSAPEGGAPVRIVYHEKGGHCGFVAKRGTSYTKEQLVGGIGGGGNGGVNVKTRGDVTGTVNDDRWIAEEMGRAMKHIHMNNFASDK